MKKIIALSILISMCVVLGINAQDNDEIFKLLNEEDKSAYLHNLSLVRSSIERAISKKHIDTLCSLPLNANKYQIISSVKNKIEIRDSVYYMYAGKYVSGTERIDMYYGYMYRSGARGPYKRIMPVVKFEEYAQMTTSLGWKKMRVLSINALTGEILLLAEDYNNSQAKWSSGEMQKYHLTPVRALSYIVLNNKF